MERVQRFFRRWMADHNTGNKDDLGTLLQCKPGTARRRYDNPGEIKLSELWAMERFAADEDLLGFLRGGKEQKA